MICPSNKDKKCREMSKNYFQIVFTVTLNKIKMMIRISFKKRPVMLKTLYGANKNLKNLLIYIYKMVRVGVSLALNLRISKYKEI